MLTTKNRVGRSVLLLAALAWGLTSCAPNGPRALLEGRRGLEAGNLTNALRCLHLATSLLPSNALAWNDLGVACHRAGLITNALAAYQRAVALNRDLYEARLNLGRLLLEQNQPEAARTHLAFCTLRRPEALEGWLNLGACQLRLNEAAAAERSYREALRLSPTNAAAWNGLGVAQMRRNRASEALQSFQAALRARPNYRPALLNAAITAHHSADHRPLALQHYRQYLALTPRPADWDSVNRVASALESELARAAVPATNNTARAPGPAPAKAATNLPPRLAAVPKPATAGLPVTSTPPALAPVATSPATPPATPPASTSEPKAASASEGGRPGPSGPTVAASSPPPSASLPAAEAPAPKRTLLQRVNPLNMFKRQPKTPPRPTPLATPVGQPAAQAVAGQSAPLSAPDDRAVQASGGGAVAAQPPPIPRYPYRAPAKPTSGDRAAAERFFAQGVAAQRAGKLAEALVAYREATRLDPAYFEAHYNLGVAAAQAGSVTQSLAAYENALAVLPDSVDARYNFALGLKQGGFLLDAAAELERIVAHRPADTRARLALANLYARQLQQPARAHEHYRKLLEIEPRHPEATAIRYWLVEHPL